MLGNWYRIKEDDWDKVELLGVDLVVAASQDESEDCLGRVGSGHAKPRAVGCGPWYQALATRWIPRGPTGDQQQYGEGVADPSEQRILRLDTG